MYFSALVSLKIQRILLSVEAFQSSKKRLSKNLCTSLHDKSMRNTRARHRERILRKCVRCWKTCWISRFKDFMRFHPHSHPHDPRTLPSVTFLLRLRIPSAERCLRTCLRVRLSTDRSILLYRKIFVAVVTELSVSSLETFSANADGKLI